MDNFSMRLWKLLLKTMPQRCLDMKERKSLILRWAIFKTSPCGNCVGSLYALVSHPKRLSYVDEWHSRLASNKGMTILKAFTLFLWGRNGSCMVLWLWNLVRGQRHGLVVSAMAQRLWGMRFRSVIACNAWNQIPIYLLWKDVEQVISSKEDLHHLV
jgi:hypothetical protein